MALNAFDLLVIVLVGLLVLLGLRRGLARLLIGIGALVAAFILAARFHGLAAEAVSGALDVPEPAANLLGYLAILLGTLLAGAVAGRLLRGLLEMAMLGWADRLAGAAAGLVAALFASALIILPVIAYLPAGERLLRDSVLAPHVTLFSDLANAGVPEELASHYRERMDALRGFWLRRGAPAGPAGEGSAADAAGGGDATAEPEEPRAGGRRE